jgi:hypothetical protein
MSCLPQQQALTRPRFDEFHQADDMRIASYKARYYLNVPNHNCPTTFVVDPTMRLQYSGQSWVSGAWRTDVESDLRGTNRLGNRVKCDGSLATGQYDPRTNKFTQAVYESPQDESFPQVFNHLTNPPCTLRATGWNRWISLPQQPQDTFETPFDFFIPSRQLDKELCKSHKGVDKS